MMARASPVTLVGFGAMRGLVPQQHQHQHQHYHYHYHMMIVMVMVQLVPCFVVHSAAVVVAVVDVVVVGDGGDDDGASEWVRTVNDGIGSQSMMVPVVVVVVVDDVVMECSVVDDDYDSEDGDGDRWDNAVAVEFVVVVVVSVWVSP